MLTTKELKLVDVPKKFLWLSDSASVSLDPGKCSLYSAEASVPACLNLEGVEIPNLQISEHSNNESHHNADISITSSLNLEVVDNPQISGCELFPFLIGEEKPQPLVMIDTMDPGNRLITAFQQCSFSDDIGQKLERYGIKNAVEKMAELQQSDAMVKALIKRLKNVKGQKRDLSVSKMDDGIIQINFTQGKQFMTQAKECTQFNPKMNATFFSDPFHLDMHPYKLCLEMNMVSDGDRSSAHLSIFVHVMKGDYDCVLKWPFQHNVTIFLKNNFNRRGDIVRNYQLNKDVQGKPTADQDITFGGEFATYDQLQNCFTSDNEIFLQCRVHF